MKKLIIGTSLVLATLAAATPTFAATHHSRTAQPYVTNDSAYESNAAVPTVSGPAVLSYGGEYAGWDPDPSIRLNLMKDPGDLAN